MRWLARHRAFTLIVLAGVVAVSLSAWLGRDDQTYAARLDPRNPDGDGAQAVARVLDDQGVDVEIVRSADALEHSTSDAATTIVVTSSGNLGRSTTTRLLRHQAESRLVVVAPGPQLVRQLGLDSFPRTSTTSEELAAGCPAYDGLALRASTAEAFGGPGCFRGPGGVVLAEPRTGLTLLGADSVLTNDQVLVADNAAIALRLLGQRPRLVWYVPDLADLGGRDSVSAASLLPAWLVPALWALAVAAGGLIVWRARRLGPLAREPLPVEVKAVETTRNLGRLYRRAGDRAHAAHALRSAARYRLAERLHLPRAVPPDRLVDDVAAHTGRPSAEIDALIGPAARPPSDDRLLAALAHDLTRLDEEVSFP